MITELQAPQQQADINLQSFINNISDLNITTLTFDPTATEIIACCVCGCQRDKAVASNWKQIDVAGRISHVCSDEFSSVYENAERFREEMTFAVICSINDYMIELGLPPQPEAEELRSRIRGARGRMYAN